MDAVEFSRQARVVIVAGKGGVGKTTITAAFANMAAAKGVDTLIVELDGKSAIPADFGLEGTLDYEEVVLREPGDSLSAQMGECKARVRARRLTPDDALIEYLADHGMARISKRLASSGVLDVVATAIPGIRDILVLGKIKQLDLLQSADLIVVDAPATGHTMGALSSAFGLMDAVQVGPIRLQTSEVIEFLGDPKRCEVLLVTLAEETPVNEVAEAAFELEDKIGIKLGPVIVNCLLPVCGVELDADGEAAGPGNTSGLSMKLPSSSALQKGGALMGLKLSSADCDLLSNAMEFETTRHALQQRQLARLSELLPLPQVGLPLYPTSKMDPAGIGFLSSKLEEAIAKMEPR